MAKKVGVILAGCGVYDGSEVHEAVLTLLFLDRAGVNAVCMAPNMDQYHVINHLNGEPMGETRNVLVESARIARGEIRDMEAVRGGDLDALVIPGGFGAAKNLSDFAVKGAEASVHPEVARLLLEIADAGKPIGAVCIAPAAVAEALADRSPELTIGNDQDTAAAIEAMGASHHKRSVTEILVDERNRIVSTPAYMLGPGIKEVAEGIEKLVDQVVAMIG